MNIPALLLRTVERFPDGAALVHAGRRWTYAEWLGRVSRLAHALSELGVRPSDRVAFYVHTSEASVTTYFACQLLGAAAVPLNFRLAAGEVRHILRDSGARVLVYGRPLADTVLAVAPEVRAVHEYVCCAGPDEEVPPGHLRFEDLAERSAGPGMPWPEPLPTHCSALVYTSGTTGRPKGVMHSHGNDVSIAMNCVMEYSLSRRDTALHVAPLYHVGGMQAYFIPHVMVGATNVLLGRGDPVITLETIQAERVTTLFAVPTQIQDLLFHPRLGDFDVSTLRMITTGGAAISAATMERVIGELCPNVYNGYGLTEASLALLLHPEEALSHLGSCGKPTLITRCRVVRDTGEPAEPCEVGQLVVRGPQTMLGYWNDPPGTERKLRDGWLQTGDLFSVGADGFYTFHGRVDDMIVSGGENIYPREVEEVLYRCPGVKEAAVVGLPDPRWGSVVAAFVVKGSPDLSVGAVDAFCRASPDLAPFKRPRRIAFLEALPMNPSGKVLKGALVARLPVAAA
ncbi:MAG: class I adenylate-forming enzyme family protein [Solirubrobacteraceae bacterium]